jgi:exodeoxyribonuclease VII small subunit
MSEEKISFEDKIEQAKEHLEKLVQPDITLSDSMKFYKEGMKELEIASKLLEEAKLEFEEISKEETF